MVASPTSEFGHEGSFAIAATRTFKRLLRNKFRTFMVRR